MSLTREGPTRAASRAKILDRQAIAKGARDRKAEFRILSADAQIAAGGHGAAASRACARYRGNGRNPAAIEAAKNAVHKDLIAERVVGRLEILEKRDVGSGRESFRAGAGYDQDPDGIVRIHSLASLRELLVHLEGTGVARFGPIDGDPGDAATYVKEKILGLAINCHPVLASAAEITGDPVRHAQHPDRLVRSCHAPTGQKDETRRRNPDAPQAVQQDIPIDGAAAAKFNKQDTPKLTSPSATPSRANAH